MPRASVRNSRASLRNSRASLRNSIFEGLGFIGFRDPTMVAQKRNYNGEYRQWVF